MIENLKVKGKNNRFLDAIFWYIFNCYIANIMVFDYFFLDTYEYNS